MAEMTTTLQVSYAILWVLVLAAAVLIGLLIAGVIGRGSQGAAIQTPQGATSEVGSFDIAAPQSLPYDGSFALKKTFGSAAVVNLIAEDGVGAPVTTVVRSRVGKDVSYRIQSVPRLGAYVNMSFAPTPHLTLTVQNNRINILALPDGKMALGVKGTVGGNATRLAYFLSNDNGGFKKPVDFLGADAGAYAFDMCVNTNDNKPMAAIFDATTPTFTFRKADDSNGTGFSGTNSSALTAQAMIGGSDSILAANDDIRLIMVNKKPMLVWLSETADSCVYVKPASDLYGAAWGTTVEALDTGTASCISCVECAIVNGRLAVLVNDDVSGGSGGLQFARASNDAGTTWNTKITLAPTYAAASNATAFKLVPGVKNSAGVIVPVAVYIGGVTTAADVYVCEASDVDAAAWSTSETMFPNSTILDDQGVYCGINLGVLGAIADPDGNLIVVAIAQDMNHFLVWKCVGATPPSEPLVLDISSQILSITANKMSGFGFEVVHGKPTMAWTESDGVLRLRWVQFNDFSMAHMIHMEYAVQG
jgi:hypothetical protein